VCYGVISLSVRSDDRGWICNTRDSRFDSSFSGGGYNGIKVVDAEMSDVKRSGRFSGWYLPLKR